jgi:hypothetical protein
LDGVRTELNIIGDGAYKAGEFGIITDPTYSGDVTGQMSGIMSSAYHQGSGAVTEMNAFISDAELTSAGTIQDMEQFYAYGIGVGSGGTVANAYSYRSRPYIISGTLTNMYQFAAGVPDSVSGTVSHNYGFYSADLSAVGPDSYNFYSAGANAKNYFAGLVGVGTSTPWRTLSVTGTVGFDGLTGATGAGSLCLSANKEVVYNSGSDNCLSSLRSTKHNINNLTLSGTSTVAALVPVSFIYNNDASSTVELCRILGDEAIRRRGLTALQ